MKNKMTPELKTFIEKVQNTMSDLYEEYASLPESVDVQYECPLTRFIDDGQDFYCMKIEDTINENL